MAIIWGRDIGKLPHLSMIKRAGVIPYTIINGDLWFLMGVDAKTKDLSDFGGGRENRESIIDCAYREFIEETCGIFSGDVSLKNLQESLVVPGLSMMVFFVYVDGSKWFEMANDSFRQALGKTHYLHGSNGFTAMTKHNREHSCMVWLSREFFFDVIFNVENSCLWSVLKNFFMRYTSSIEIKQGLGGAPGASAPLRRLVKVGVTSALKCGD
jgi:hypothetical protein